VKGEKEQIPSSGQFSTNKSKEGRKPSNLYGRNSRWNPFAQRNLSLHLLPFETQPPRFCARAPLLLSLIVAIVAICLDPSAGLFS
jgi:hypothetical protein